MQKNILLSIAFSLANFNVNNLVAQEQKLFTNESIAQLFSKNHIAFTAKGVLFEKGKIVGESALFNPASHKTLGCEIGADYFMSGIGKILISPHGYEWLLQNKMEYLFMNVHQSGRLSSSTGQQINTISNFLHSFGGAFKIGILFLELAGIFILFRRKGST